MKIKLSLHTHIDKDPVDNIKYSGFDLIDQAQKEGFSVLAFTCHDKFISPTKYEKYARKKGILLIPGIEKTIQKKHVLILNATKKTKQIETFEDLKLYKQNNPNCFIIAPHPYFYISSLESDLEKHIHLFDAIEYNFFYHRFFNLNKKAKYIAKKYNKPLIGTSDLHFLTYINHTYTEITVSKLTIENIIIKLKKNELEIITKSFSILELIKLLFKMVFLNSLNKKNVFQIKKSISRQSL